MSGQNRRRVLVLVVVCLLVTGMLGCNAVKDESNQYLIQMNQIPHFAYFNATNKSRIQNEKLYCLYEEDNEGGVGTNSILSFSYQDEKFDFESLETLIEKKDLIDFVVDKENTLYALGIEDGKYVIYSNSDGKTEKIPLERNVYNDERWIGNIEVTEDGIILLSDEILFFLDWDCKVVKELKIEKGSLNMLLTRKNELLVDSDGYMSLIDTKNKEVVSKKKTKREYLEIGNQNNRYAQSGQYDLVFVEDNKLYGYNYEGNQLSLVVDFDNILKEKMSVVDITYLDESKYLLQLMSGKQLEDRISAVMTIQRKP